MRHEPISTHTTQADPVTLVAATWLACGIVLLILTPLPLHDETLGWSPAFWLLAAPALTLVARRAQAARIDRAAPAARAWLHPRSRRPPAARRWHTRARSEAAGGNTTTARERPRPRERGARR